MGGAPGTYALLLEGTVWTGLGSARSEKAEQQPKDCPLYVMLSDHFAQARWYFWKPLWSTCDNTTSRD